MAATERPQHYEASPGQGKYIDIAVSSGEVAQARNYLTFAPRARLFRHHLPNGASFHVAVNDTIFSRGRPSHALGGIRVDTRSSATPIEASDTLASDLASDMGPKYLTLHEMLERADAPESVREAARHDGGKAVLRVTNPAVLEESQREETFGRIGMLIRGMNGLYVPGADMGTDAHDMSTIARAAGEGVDVSCQEGEIPNSEITAVGVFHAVKATIEHQRENNVAGWDKEDPIMTFQGLGNVGQPLLLRLMQQYPEMRFNLLETNQEKVAQTLQKLREHGIAEDRIRENLKQVDANDVEEIRASLEESDGFIPNAGPNVITHSTIDALREGAIYVGAANDIIPKVDGVDDPTILARTKSKGIVGVAAYQANCGGIAAIAVQDAGGTQADAERYMEGVHALVKDTLAEAAERDLSPETVAIERTHRHFARYVKAKEIDLRAA